HGANVAIVDIAPDTPQIAEQMCSHAALGVVADVRDRDAMDRAVAEAVDRFGRVDVAIANADWLAPEDKRLGEEGYATLVSRIGDLRLAVSALMGGWFAATETEGGTADRYLDAMVDLLEEEQSRLARIKASPLIQMALDGPDRKREAAKLADEYLAMWGMEISGKERALLILGLHSLHDGLACPPRGCGGAWRSELLSAWPVAIEAWGAEESLSTTRKGEEQLGIFSAAWLYGGFGEKATDKYLEIAQGIESKDHRLAALGMVYLRLVSSRWERDHAPF
ncbi:SDR family oxidoreductase, partial [bacterium]|nr:SDR family oxidoreductase [bacterium]